MISRPFLLPLLALCGCAFLVCQTCDAATYPLKVSSTNKRLLVDQNNAPFLLVGDSPHALIVNLNVADAARFFEDRRTNGFNSMWIEVICEDSEAGRADGSLLDGTTPFTNTLGGGLWDMSTPNEAYFSHVDTIVRLAATNGLQLLFNPADTGGWDGGWMETMLTNGAARCRQYGQFLGNRYKDFPNIIWFSGNDFQAWRTPTNDAVVSAIARGIKDFDSNHLQTVQFDYPVSASLDNTNWASIVNVNFVYSYYAQYERVLREYQRTNVMPVVMIEGHYEYQTNYYGDFGTLPVLRRQMYWSMLSGAVGHCYGNDAVWPFQPGWDAPAILNSPAITELKHVTALFQSRRWHAFVPDLNRTVLTAGFGTYATNAVVSANNYATCARETNGNTVMVYAPTRRAMTIDMSKLSGTNALAWWFNPQTGGATNFGSFPTTGTRSFTPPDTNDWVLVLDDAAKNFATPGSTPLSMPLQVSTNALLPARVGGAYTAVFSAAGGTTPYRWTLSPSSAPLPGGLNLSTNGILSGAPVAEGSFDFSVMVTDAEGVTAVVPQTLAIAPPPAGASSFTNSGAITIPDVGLASPYPAQIEVAGLGGVLGHVAVKLADLNHPWPGDLEMLLVSPTGKKALVMSNAGKSPSAGAVSITFSDAAAVPLPENEPITSGLFRATGYPPNDDFPAPAPAAPFVTNFASFLGDSPNGIWSLFVHDDTAGNGGVIGGGWSLELATVILPQLDIEVTEVNDVVLRWAAPEPPFYVQTLAELGGTNWETAPVVPALDGSRYYVNLPATNAAAFYRLLSTAAPLVGEATGVPLEIVPAAGGVITLRWPVASAITFVLEQSSDLSGKNWSPVTTGRGAWADGTNSLSLSATNGASFFRLRLP